MGSGSMSGSQGAKPSRLSRRGILGNVLNWTGIDHPTSALSPYGGSRTDKPRGLRMVCVPEFPRFVQARFARL
jgi:hypothetical protein